MSSWQLGIDWLRVRAAGVGFAYIRATWGLTGVDTYFEANRANCTIPWAGYHLFKGNMSGEAQAYHFTNTIRQWDAAHPPAVDVEPVADDTSTPAERTLQLRHFVTTMVELTGFWPVIYTGGDWNRLITPEFDGTFAQCKLWVAQYHDGDKPTPLPRTWSYWWLWQYSSSGRIEGITERVDLNRWK